MRLPYIGNSPMVKLKVLGPSGEKEYYSYLDTGATKTLIPEIDTLELDLTYSGEIAFLTASGEDIFRLYDAEVEFIGERHHILVLGRDFPRTTPIRSIISRDILDQYRVCFDGKRKEIEIT